MLFPPLAHLFLPISFRAGDWTVEQWGMLSMYSMAELSVSKMVTLLLKWQQS